MLYIYWNGKSAFNQSKICAFYEVAEQSWACLTYAMILQVNDNLQLLHDCFNTVSVTAFNDL